MLKGKQIRSRTASLPRHTIAEERGLMAKIQASKFIPAGEVIADLEKRAGEYDTAAKQMSEPEASKFRELAELCRGWIKSLKYGNWTS